MLKALLLEEPAREALRLATAALDAAELNARPFQMSQALADVARCYRALGALASAESHLEAALRWGRLAGSTDPVVDLLCELCETAASLAEMQNASGAGSGHAARERARDHVFEASTLAGCVADAGWEVKVLLRISDVLDRCGDRDNAVQLQTRALRLMATSPATGAPNPALLPSIGRLADG
jgi:tetratricopeptide (TPR) repeat protein